MAYQEFVMASPTDADLSQGLQSEYKVFVRARRDYALANISA